MDSDLLILPREDPDWQKAYEAVNGDSDNLDLWEVLIELTERIQQAASKKIQVRYSSSNRKQQEFPEVYAAIKETTRATYDRFLEKFVLLFGYWTKYAELEIQFAQEQGEEDGEIGGHHDGGAQRVFERAVAAFPVSVDLWTAYLGFMISHLKSHTPKAVEALRTLFERGAELVGRDFLSHPFWDKYLEFEESLGGSEMNDRLVKILARIIQIPLHQYARYYEKFSGVLASYTGSHADLIALAPLPSPAEDITTHFTRVFQRTQQGTTDRWQYESRISRSYFHVVELEQDQIENWHAYLTWEESQRDFEQIRSLYERALVPGALYDTFWLRYARWMMKVSKSNLSTNNQTLEEVRNIFRRASTVFVPISRPFIRYQFALFEESQGEIVAARDIINSVQRQNPDTEEPFTYRVEFERRVGGIEAVISYTEALLQPSTKSTKIIPAVEEVTVSSSNVKAFLLATQAKSYASLLKPDIPKARAVFKQNANKYLSSKHFWVSYFEFEISEAKAFIRNLNSNDSNPDEAINQKLLQTHVQTYLDPLWSNMIAFKSHLPPSLIADLSRLYADFLSTTGVGPATPWAARTAFVDIDLEVNGPLVKRTRLLAKLADYSGSPAASLQRLKMENGHPGVEINPLQKQNQQSGISQSAQDSGDQAFGRYYAAQAGLSTY